MSSEKIYIKSKPIKYVQLKTDSCIICYDGYNKDISIVQCKSCKNDIHKCCQIDWCVSNILDGQKATCPYCRAEWIQGEYNLYPVFGDLPSNIPL